MFKYIILFIFVGVVLVFYISLVKAAKKRDSIFNEEVKTMEYPYKEVDFAEYCRNCKYADVDDVKDPCNECLDTPCVEHSRKPINYKPDERRIKENTPMPIDL